MARSEGLPTARRDTRATTSATTDAPKADPRWLLGFVLFEMACQLSLLTDTIGPLRVFVRTAAFAASLGLLVRLRGRSPRHPSAAMALASLVIVGVALFHPGTSALAGLAHGTLYLAILAPIFWVPRIAVDMRTLRNLFLVLWLFQSTSSVFGALQVYFPGQFQPNTASSLDDDMLQGLRITLASGDTIFRPMGLTDTPGGAGAAGFYTVLLAMGFLLDSPRWWFRLLLIASMLAGIFAIYLCQVRSSLVMLLICVAAIVTLLGVQRGFSRFASFGLVLAATGVAGFLLAASVGGDAVTDRLATLVEANPRDVYYSNRGFFLENTITELLPRYPLGAGLGRWGMMTSYFGFSSDPERAPIWVEIQWTGWLLDGGVPLVISYFSAIAMALWFSLEVARRRVGAAVDRLWMWGIILVGYDLGALALTFNYPLFIGTLGLDFWVLNACLFAASQSHGAKAS